MKRGEKLYFKRQFLLVELNPEISVKKTKMSNKRGIKLTLGTIMRRFLEYIKKKVHLTELGEKRFLQITIRSLKLDYTGQIQTSNAWQTHFFFTPDFNNQI